MSIETQTTTAGREGPAKFSRYRSVRQPPTSPPKAPAVPTTSPQNESIARSMSRYRTRRTSKPDPSSHPPLPPKPTTPKSPQAHLASLAALTGEPISAVEESQNDSTGHETTKRSSKQTTPEKLGSLATTSPPATASSQSDHPLAERPAKPRQVSWDALCATRARTKSPQYDYQDSREILDEETERVQQEKARQEIELRADLERRRQHAAEDKRRRVAMQAGQRANREGEIDRLEKARRAVKQRHEERAAATSAADEAGKKEGPILGRRSSFRQKFGSFRKKPMDILNPGRVPRMTEIENSSALLGHRREPSKSQSTPNVLETTNESSEWVDAPVARPIVEESATSKPPQWVDAPVSRPAPREDGPVMLPQIDAPVSAVNAGERLVKIKHKSSSLTLVVTPTTTPQDLLQSASGNLSENFDLDQVKLVESFRQLGLERPLRNYEHVRDVMNSWDNDEQNPLLIVNVEAEDRIGSLDAPKQQPGDTSVYMYHSQRPGHWNKRWITLKADGQVTIAKRPGQESSNICHLTDCDVYVPTPKQAKRLRTPKKVCFAAKSQQKSNVFLDGANFVHFFSTSDRVIAAEWYKALQGWRSWYLVHIMGEGERSKEAAQKTGRLNGKSSRGGSIDRTPTKPLLSDPNTSPQVVKTTKSTSALHSRKPSNRDWVPPPSSFLNKLSKDPDSGAPTTNRDPQPPSILQGPRPDELESSTFAPAGLLGRTYSQRQRAQAQPHNTDPLQPSSHSQSHSHSHSPPKPPPTTALNRNTSTRSQRTRDLTMPKPLVDLTPQYQEPPQHAKKGRGVKAHSGQQLVDVATGLEMQPGAIVTPSARAWRRGAGPGPGPGVGAGHGTSEDDEPGLGLTRHPTRSGAQGHNHNHNHTLLHHQPPPTTEAAAAPLSSTENSGFTPSSLLARTASKRGQGSQPTGHGVRTGDRNARDAKPLVELDLGSRFGEGSLLRRVEDGEGKLK